MSGIQSFGRRARAFSDPVGLIEFEASEGMSELFAEVDALLANVIVRSLQGEPIVGVHRGRQADAVSIVGLNHALQTILDHLFGLANQHSRGAWFHPEKASLKVGLMN